MFQILDATDTHGWTMLHKAAYHGHIDSVRELIRMGSNVFFTTPKEETPRKNILIFLIVHIEMSFHLLLHSVLFILF